MTSGVPVRSMSDTRSARPNNAPQRLANGCATGGEHVTRPARSLRESRSVTPTHAMRRKQHRAQPHGQAFVLEVCPEGAPMVRNRVRCAR